MEETNTSTETMTAPEVNLDTLETILDSEPAVADETPAFNLELAHFDSEKDEDLFWQAKTGLDYDTLSGAIETVIFMSDRPVPLLKIKSLIAPEIPLRSIHLALTKLQEGYEERHHGLRLVEVAEGYQFRTKATYSKYVQEMFKVGSIMMTPTALEVLAIIAYKQPVSKTEIDKIRGVDSGHIVRALMDKRLVKMVGRSEEMGRPSLFATTPEFLEVFNLPNVEALPSMHELEAMATSGVGKISDIKGLVNSGEKGKFTFDEFSELESLSESIKNIASDTDFTKSLRLEDRRRVDQAGAPVKTAFELLEEFVLRELIAKEMRASVESNPLVAAEPQVVSDLTAGPYNTPSAEDDFQMIDLETGEAIKQDSDFDDLFATNNPEDERALADALDEAFERLGAPKSGTLPELSEELSLDESEENIEEITQSIVESGKELDLDLSFMQKSDS